MKKIIIILILTGLLAVTIKPVEAATSNTKSFKLSVTLPATVGIRETHNAKANEEVKTKKDETVLYEETVIVRNNETVLLRTSVLK